MALAWATALPREAGAGPARSRQAIVDSVLEQLRQHYIDPSRRPELERLLRAREAAGDYGRQLDDAAFANAVTRDLRSVGGSGHLNLRYRSQPLVLQSQAPADAEAAAQRAEDRRVNYGLSRVEVLDGNTGYLRMDRFGDADEGSHAVAGAMMTLARTNALLVDLRANRGGGALFAVLASYFLPPEPRLLSTLEYPRRGESIQIWSQAGLAGPRYGDRPVFVLTSRQTFSAGEAFAYHLQALGRVKVVGQSTGGGADPNLYVPVDPHFSLSIPVGRTVDATTHSSWEGVGVQPDVPTATPELALGTAQALAVEAASRRPPTTA